MAFWLDYDNAYWTLTSDYIQSVWWALSEMWKQGLVYKGFRVAPYCPRCATPLSSHELALGYRDNVPDPSVFVRFRLEEGSRRRRSSPGRPRPGRCPATSRWRSTTTSTTSRSRMATSFLILAEARLEVLDESPEVVERMKGTRPRRSRLRAALPVLDPERGSRALRRRRGLRLHRRRHRRRPHVGPLRRRRPAAVPGEGHPLPAHGRPRRQVPALRREVRRPARQGGRPAHPSTT